MSDANTASPGAVIDAALAPFTEDETRLIGSIADARAKIQKLEDEMAEAERDLAVVRSAKIDALKQAVADNDLLAAAFLPAADGEPATDSDGHPLLKPKS